VLGRTPNRWSGDQFSRAKLVDCDIQGEVQWQGACEMTVEDTRHEGYWEHPDRTVGQLTSNPDLSVPAGVPMTPEEGALGTSSADGGSSGGGGGSSDYDHTLEVLCTENAQELIYTAQVSGGAAKATVNGTGSEDHDTMESLDNGGTRILGRVGNGYGDAYTFEGELRRFAVRRAAAGDSSDVTLKVDGSAVDPSSLGGPAPVGDSTSLPTDPDDDGRFEDVTGDGTTDFDDVVTFFEHRNGDAVGASPEAFDFDGNGNIEWADVITLLEEI
jgi:PKD repeat protein